jgi:phage/plasmid-associated DNA primase
LFKAVEGIKLAIEEGRFRGTHSEAQLLQMFKRRQSPLNEWLYENDITIGDLHEQRCLSLYAQFTEWCSNNGYSKLMSNFTFKDDIAALYDVEIRLKKIGDKAPTQVFYKPGDFDKNYKPF